MVRDIPWRPSPLRARSARVAFAVSLLVHAALIAKIPIDFRDISRVLEPKTEPPLEVRLVPRLVVPPPPPAAEPVPRARPLVVPPPVAPAPKPAPPRAASAPPPVPSPLALPRAPAGDLSSYIAARQRERARLEEPAPAPPAEDADARAKRIIASNLASTRNLTFGFDPSRSGGIFQVTRLALDHGEFLFHGWNMDVGRNTQQLIEVRRGNASDIRLAMVRKMIEIIRQHEPVEFVWESDRLGRAVTLSSRQRDSAGLEDFMMQEFFELKR